MPIESLDVLFVQTATQRPPRGHASPRPGDMRRFPSLCFREVTVFPRIPVDVQRVVIQDRVENDRAPRVVASLFESDSPIRGAITWTRVPRLKVDARCQNHLAGWLGGVCLDIPFPRRKSNAALSSARTRSGLGGTRNPRPLPIAERLLRRP